MGGEWGGVGGTKGQSKRDRAILENARRLREEEGANGGTSLYAFPVNKTQDSTEHLAN